MLLPKNLWDENAPKSYEKTKRVSIAVFQVMEPNIFSSISMIDVKLWDNCCSH